MSRILVLSGLMRGQCGTYVRELIFEINNVYYEIYRDLWNNLVDEGMKLEKFWNAKSR